MKRRDFITISALSGAVAALDSCGSPDHKLIRFIPDEDLIPGVATWKPSICTLCSAGCGLLVRIMQGEAEVVHNGQLGLIEMGLAKKLEGNPAHPVNQGKLCARGQAGLQAVYHPDRVRSPLKRTGSRGSGQFQEISWDDAMKELMAQLTGLRSSGSAGSLAFLSRPWRGQRGELIARFLKAFGAPAPVNYEPLSDDVLRQANLLSFGHAELPTINLANASYAISFGADFLGTWNSPVSQSVGYGAMRGDRVGRRGKFAQVEARMSQTGANADDWIPCQPGMEGVLALGIAQVILHDKLVSHDTHSRAGAAIDGWAQGLPDYTPENVEKRTGVPAATIRALANNLTQNGPGCAFIGGPALAHTNGLFNAMAVNALEALVDGAQGTQLLSFTPASPVASASAGAANFTSLNAWSQAILNGQSSAPKVLLMDDSNPVFTAPPDLRVREAIAKIPYMVSFGSFINETSAWADLILPDNASLESWLDDVPESGTTSITVSLAAPAVHPLHNTRATPDVLLDIAQQLGGSVAAALPWKTFDLMLQAAYVPLRKQKGSVTADSDDDFWSMMQDQGGWWGAGDSKTATPATAAHAAPKAADPQFDGAAADFPFYFLPYSSQAFRDGSLAHLPWLQEMPDVVTTAMWSSWVEVNTQTAARLNIQAGDMVEIASPHGSIKAAAVVSPGIAPDVIGMPIGQGHEYFTRYASGRGSNPLSILGTLTEQETGTLAWAATRVKITRSGGPQDGTLVLYSGGMSRFPHPEEEPR